MKITNNMKITNKKKKKKRKKKKKKKKNKAPHLIAILTVTNNKHLLKGWFYTPWP